MPGTQGLQPQQKSSAQLQQEEAEARQRFLEKLAQVRSTREGLMLNKGAVLKGDPMKEYHWVNLREERRIAFEQEGWEVVKVDRENPKVLTNFPPQEDGTIKRGDLILYQIDKELYEAMQVYNVGRGLELTEQSKEGIDFAAVAKRLGVPVFRPKVA